MRGIHGRTGPVPGPRPTKRRQGRRTATNTAKLGTPVDDCTPPPTLSEAETGYWRYYAERLHEGGRLTAESRDVLAGLCCILATVDRLRQQMAAPEYRDVLLSVTIDGSGAERITAKANPLLAEVRHWLAIARQYEADLMLTPAVAIRAPLPDRDEELEQQREHTAAWRAFGDVAFGRKPFHVA